MAVFARKYRPRQLSELVGQHVVVQTLSNAFKMNKLHHAYLFVGHVGSGKTSTARILAAMENCEKSPGLYPCGECSVCSGIFKGTHADIEEIDAASQAGKVDQVRQLKTDAMYGPIDGAKIKYYIIDECHRMSPASSEALLKLIEEPPPRIRFILCTTEAESVRGTIMSRCQVHEFRKIYWRQISERLGEVAEKEKIESEKEALNICSRLAQGSMRTALQNLEKLAAYNGGKKITGSDAQKMFATVSEVLFYDVIDQILGVEGGKPDATKGFKLINSMLINGADFAMICNGLAEHLRHIMVGLSCQKAADFIDVSEEGKRRLLTQLKKCKNLTGIFAAYKHLHEARQGVEYGLSPEIALQKWLLESVFAFH